MECAGQRPRAARAATGQPAVAARGGRDRRVDRHAAGPLLDEAGIADGAVEVVFTGLDRGVEGGVEQVYQRSLPLADALRDDVLLAYEMNGEPLPPQHGFPLRLVVPGWYGMTNVKWLERIDRRRPAVRRLPAGAVVPGAPERGRGRRAALPDAAALAVRAARNPRLLHTRALRRRRRGRAGRPRVVGLRVDRVGRGQHRRRRDLGRGRPGRRRASHGRGAAGGTPGRRSRATTSSVHVRATRRGTSSRSTRRGTSAVTRTTPSSVSR